MLLDRSGEGLVEAAVAAIEEAQTESSGTRLAALTGGHARFRRLRGEAIYSPCVGRDLEKAAAELAAGGSPFRHWVEVDRAVCAYFSKDLPQAEATLLAVLVAIDGRPYRALEGRVRWLLALIRLVQGRFAEADQDLERAIGLFEAIGEPGHSLYIRSLRAKESELLGQRERAWQERYPALLRRHEIDDPERVYTVVEEVAQALARQGRRLAARHFLSEQVRAASAASRSTGQIDLLAYSLLDRAALASELGARDEAARDLARAEALWRDLPPGHESRERLRRELDLARAPAGLDGNPAESLAAVDRALGFFAGEGGGLGDQVETLRLLRLRARVNLGRGDDRSAEEDLLRGIQEAEAQRLRATEPEERARFLAREADLYQAMVRLQLEARRDPAAALEFQERAGARLLTDIATGGGRRHDDDRGEGGLRSALASTSVPDDALIVRYGHLPDRLLIWTLLAGRLKLEEHRVQAGELREAVGRFRTGVRSSLDGTQLGAVGQSLARLVLPRRLQELPAGGSLILIPDEILLSLPFAALPLPEGGGLLIDRRAPSFAPSLALLLRQAPHRDRAARAAASGALFISDPAFDPALFPRLRRLDAARRSLAAQAALYPGSTLLQGTQATRRALLAALPGSRVVHFDGHGLTDPVAPERGGLVLASEEPGVGGLEGSLLRASDVRPADLRSLELVVLAGCRTALATYPDTAEVAGLAAAFLAHGVPRVVTAAWEIEDGEAAGFFLAFHRELAGGLSAEEALRRAQLDLLRGADPERARHGAWAAYQVFRGKLREKVGPRPSTSRSNTRPAGVRLATPSLDGPSDPGGRP